MFTSDNKEAFISNLIINKFNIFINSVTTSIINVIDSFNILILHFY
jgi:hypothetical protein